MKKRVRNISISLALLLGVALAALAADAPRLQIQSPSQNAAIPALPNGSGVVSIKFKTDHFKIISLKDAPALNSSQNASTSNSSANPADSNSSTSNAGMGRSTAPSTGTTASNQPTSESLPQSDAGTAPSPNITANPNQGFIDVNVDGSRWHFLHTNSDAIVLAGLAPGVHKIALQLIGSDFHPVGSPQTLDFTVVAAQAK